jgi:hypothetical protein
MARELVRGLTAIHHEEELLSVKLIPTRMDHSLLGRDRGLAECPVFGELGHDFHLSVLITPAPDKGRIGQCRGSGQDE